uniref:Ig-like domain-containing protein n=1 Tax=Apteryx owenii TaxID=8824 RepID=A0A8B9PMP5_APTOW
MVAIPRGKRSEWPNLIEPQTTYEKDCSAKEKKQWEKREAKQNEDGIWTTGGKPILPKKYVVTVARWFHDKAHGGAEAVANQVQKVWAPSPGLPAFVAVGYVDGETIVHYDSETRRKVPRAAWMADNLDQQYWDHKTERCKNWQQIFHVGLDTLQKRYNQSGGYHTVQGMYGCDILENGGIQGFEQYAYDGRDFLALDKDTLTFTAADAGAEITKREREAAAEAERWKRYLETACIEELRKYVKYGKATLERRERPAVQVSGKESHGLLTLSCRAHGFYPRSIAIDWLRKGRVQAQETKRGSTAPNSDGTYHAWASIEALAAEKDEYQCCVEHASLLEPGLFSWEPESNLLPIVIGVVIAALIIVVVIASFVFWKRRSGKAPGPVHRGEEGRASGGPGTGGAAPGGGGVQPPLLGTQVS